MNRKLLVALAFVASGSSQASLLSADSAYGVGSVTRDTATGLEWLDLTQTVNLSFNQVQGGVNGYLANGFAVATTTQVELLLTHAGWDGIDASGTSGSAANLAAVQLLISLLGTVGVSGSPGESTFTEGLALNGTQMARQFNTISQNGVAGRVACTSAGFIVFPHTDTTGCRANFDQSFSFSGVYLVRETPATVPEPAMLVLVGAALAGVGRSRRRG